MNLDKGDGAGTVGVADAEQMRLQTREAEHAQHCALERRFGPEINLREKHKN